MQEISCSLYVHLDHFTCSILKIFQAFLSYCLVTFVTVLMKNLYVPVPVFVFLSRAWFKPFDFLLISKISRFWNEQSFLQSNRPFFFHLLNITPKHFPHTQTRIRDYAISSVTTRNVSTLLPKTTLIGKSEKKVQFSPLNHITASMLNSFAQATVVKNALN